jgi:hypothetical protein
MRYMIQSKTSGEIYVSDGKWACGPLRHQDTGRELLDYDLDNDAPDWVADEDGRILRASE